MMVDHEYIPSDDLAVLSPQLQLRTIISQASIMVERKHVHWEDRDNCKRHLNSTGLSAEEINRYWYSRWELKQIRRSNQELVDSMMINNHGNLNKLRDPCTRGLSGEEATRKRTHTRMGAIAAVLIEQESQFTRGTCDPEAIRKVYIRWTANSQSIAHMMGLFDRREVTSELSQEGDPLTVQPCRTPSLSRAA